MPSISVGASITRAFGNSSSTSARPTRSRGLHERRISSGNDQYHMFDSAFIESMWISQGRILFQTILSASNVGNIFPHAESYALGHTIDLRLDVGPCHFFRNDSTSIPPVPGTGAIGASCSS